MGEGRLPIRLYLLSALAVTVLLGVHSSPTCWPSQMSLKRIQQNHLEILFVHELRTCCCPKMVMKCYVFGF